MGASKLPGTAMEAGEGPLRAMGASASPQVMEQLLPLCPKQVSRRGRRVHQSQWSNCSILSVAWEASWGLGGRGVAGTSRVTQAVLLWAQQLLFH